MPPAVTDSLDIWAVDSQIGADGSISVDFLLPTGIYINLDVPRDATISHIKQVIPNGQLTLKLTWIWNECSFGFLCAFWRMKE